MFVVFKKELTITLYICPRSSGKTKEKSAGSLNTLFLSRVFYQESCFNIILRTGFVLVFMSLRYIMKKVVGVFKVLVS